MGKFKIESFSNLDEKTLDKIVNEHFKHWSKHNPKMDKKSTNEKFKTIYTKNDLPFGICLLQNKTPIGFCVLKKDNLKSEPDIYPWISDLLIFSEHRNKKAGTYLVQKAQDILKKSGFSCCYVWTDVAPQFYEKLGFDFVKQIEKNEGGIGLLFKRDLKK